MNIKEFMALDPNEKPLDLIKDDGGYTSIFRTIGVVGDSLASGEFESLTEDGQRGYHDYYEYSWGQYIARAAGCKVYNFSRGGMTAKEYFDSFAEHNDFWNTDYLCQAYIIALGANDLGANHKEPIGSVDDIVRGNLWANQDTFAGQYAKIIQKLKLSQPYAKFFLVTMPQEADMTEEARVTREGHAKLMHDLAKYFDRTYVVDLYKELPPLDKDFSRRFRLGGHMNPMGYAFFGKVISTYIDYIIRHNPEDFAQVGFIEKTVFNCEAKR